MAKQSLLVVHPGSLCGSMWTSGLENCEGVTRNIVEEIENWDGPSAAIFGELEDEIKDYANLNIAVEGIPTVVKGSPTELGLTRAARAVLRLHEAKNLQRVLITGAWADPKDVCVTAVAEAMRKFRPGLQVDISPNAPVYPGA